VKVTATADEIAAAGGSLALGSLSYNPGVIGALSRTVALDEGANGSIETAKDGANKESTALQTHIDDFTVRLQQVELRYRLQFSRLETTLGQLRDQSSWLASQIANLP
jgi:flagellar hook-associated protein 2